MESRTLKYMDTGSNDIAVTNTRSSRNARLYREIYGKYGELDNLPIQDNTDEIDMAKLKEIVNRNTTNKEHNTPVHIEKRDTVTQDEQKIYDINQLLERAKYENSKLKDQPKKTTQINRKILSTLESNELTVDQFKEACKKYETEKKYINTDKENEELSMTREMKYRTMQISADPLIEQVMPDNDLSLDLFSDLKPTGNTIVTKPISDEQFFPSSQNSDSVKNVKDDFHSNDISDIDVIKKNVKKDNIIDNDFYTSSYKFSKKDFTDDDFCDDKPTGNILKIFLLVVAIIIFIFVIYYFVMNYGLGI